MELHPERERFTLPPDSDAACIGRPPAGREVNSHFCLCVCVCGSIVVSISTCHAEDPGSIPGRGVGSELIAFASATNKVQGALWPRVFTRSDSANSVEFAETRDRAGDLQIFSLTLSQLSYRGYVFPEQAWHI